MAKLHTFPPLIDYLLQIDLSFIKKNGFLKPNSRSSFDLTWSNPTNAQSSISVFVDTLENDKFIQLKYTVDGKTKDYRVRLAALPSNLGKGYVYYLVCPLTSKLCRKLYLIDGYFLHRSACSGAMYEIQTMPKTYRRMDKYLRAHVKHSDLLKEINSKYFKKHYAGKPTRRYMKILKELKQAEKINELKIEELLISG